LEDVILNQERCPLQTTIEGTGHLMEARGRAKEAESLVTCTNDMAVQSTKGNMDTTSSVDAYALFRSIGGAMLPCSVETKFHSRRGATQGHALVVYILAERVDYASVGSAIWMHLHLAFEQDAVKLRDKPGYARECVKRRV
jgi:hypothetical protein